MKKVKAKKKESVTFTVLLYGNWFAGTIEIKANNTAIIGSSTCFINDSDEAWRFEREYSWSSITEMNLDIMQLLKLFTGNNVTIEFFMKKPWNTEATESEIRISEALCGIIGITRDGHRR